MTHLELNEQLLDAVAQCDLTQIQQCLQAGADIHYVRALDAQGDNLQPVTVLSMVMFRISDNMLQTHELTRFKEITALLLSCGADTEHAMALAEQRYGPYDEKLVDQAYTMMPPWHLIARANRQRNT